AIVLAGQCDKLFIGERRQVFTPVSINIWIHIVQSMLPLGDAAGILRNILPARDLGPARIPREGLLAARCQKPGVGGRMLVHPAASVLPMGQPLLGSQQPVAAWQRTEHAADGARLVKPPARSRVKRGPLLDDGI